MQRMKIASLLLLLAIPLTAQAGVQTSVQTTSPLCDQLRALTVEPAVSSAHWGIAVETLDGALVCGINQAQLFRPASNAKLFTAGAALALLGPRQTVTTSVTGGPIAGETLAGDLTLHGTGDANLSTRPIPYVRSADASAAPPRVHPFETLAATVRSLGVTHITGDIIGDDSVWPNAPYAPAWSLDDTLFGYGAPVSALIVDDNKLTLSIHPGATVNARSTVAWTPAIEFYDVDNSVRTGRAGSKTEIHIAHGATPQTLRISGSIALGSEPYTDDVAIDDPALYAAVRLKTELRAAGIQVDGRPRVLHQRPKDAEEAADRAEHRALLFPAEPGLEEPRVACLDACPGALARYDSVPLLDDVTVTLKISQNLHAELLLRRMGERFLATGSEAAGVRVVRQFWLNAGLSKDDILLFDGSGLSTQDLVAPRALAQLLVYAATQPWFAGFRSSLPVGGVDGSLAGRFGGALKGRILAKTGTLGESRALSGYVTAASGRIIVFSILVDNHLPSSTADRTAVDKMVELIAAAN